MKADYTTVPRGRYVCRIADVRVGKTRNDDERWSWSLIVDNGSEYDGKLAAWDSIVWSSRGASRVNFVFKRLGLDAGGKVEPSDLVGKRIMVDVRPSEYQNAAGDTVRRNEVPWDGYYAVPEEEQ